MYEYDLKFPYESQITISVKDWGGNKGLIGKTLIDLENRFYSDCFASCGLAKKYETTGYNAWRDILTPTQILNRLCKKWRLKLPEYEEFSVKILCSDNKSKEYRHETTSSSQEKIIDVNNQFNQTNPNIPINDPKAIKEELALMVLHDWHHITGVIFDSAIFNARIDVLFDFYENICSTY